MIAVNLQSVQPERESSCPFGVKVRAIRCPALALRWWPMARSSPEMTLAMTREMATDPVSDLITVLVSVPSDDTGRAIGRAVVEQRLAACAQIMPIASVYRWQGAVVEDDEALLVLKTRVSLFAPLAAAIRARHPYQTPQITALPVVAADSAYRDWVLAETAAASG